jgi:hypothetical protein
MTRLLVIIGACAAIACTQADGAADSDQAKPAAQSAAKQTPQGRSANADAQALAEFNQRVKQYAELHKRIEATLPYLPKETNPTVIDQHERALEKLLKAERKNARPGDIITADTKRVFRQILARVFSGADGRELKAAILDENPGKIALTVNSRYPDQVPLSTVPPQVLATLPRLPPELEYRFIGERMILLDVHAHTIADYMDNAFPS